MMVSKQKQSKPLIGVTGRQYPYGDVAGSPPILAEALVDAVLTDYITAVVASGGLAVHIPFDVDPAEIVAHLDGIVLTGGADIGPARYDAKAAPETGQVDDNRDAFELAIAAAAIEQSAPTLGVCRGLQVLNVAGGGTLKQHVPSHARYDAPPRDLVHAVAPTEGSMLHGIFGPIHRVNSYHHQTIDQPGPEFAVTASADDGEIEALEIPGKPILGVQWHPEMLRAKEPLFDWLIETSGES